MELKKLTRESNNESPEPEMGGPTLYIDGDQMKALGLEQNPEVGAEYFLHAKVVVKSASESKYDDTVERSTSFEVTEAALESGSGKSMAEVMYGDS